MAIRVAFPFIFIFAPLHSSTASHTSMPSPNAMSCSNTNDMEDVEMDSGYFSDESIGTESASSLGKEETSSLLKHEDAMCDYAVRHIPVYESVAMI